jgi:hypothetical protein
MAKKKGKKKTDSKDTVRVTEQLDVIKATTDEKTLDAIADADNRPNVVAAIKERRKELLEAEEAKAALEELTKLEQEADPGAEPGLQAEPEMKAVDAQLDEIEKTLAPIAETAKAPEPVAEEPAEKEPEPEPEKAPEPPAVSALAGGVTGSLTPEEEETQEVAADRAGDRRAMEEEAERRNAKVAADHALNDVKRAKEELERAERVASAAMAKVAREEAKGKPKPPPAPKPEPKEKEPAPEGHPGGSAPPAALL